MSKVLLLDNKSFNSEVLSSSIPVLVDFWADWCGPCRMMAPILEEVASEIGSQFKVAKLNVDTNQDLAATYGVMSIPTLIIFKDGQELKRLVGVQPKEKLLEHMKGALS